MTGVCPFCDKNGVEMVGTGELQFCRACADLIDVPAALKHLPDRPEDGSARLGKYEIVKEAGRGVTGVVYEARDPGLDRRVAVKVLDTERLGADPVRRFMREGRLLAKIRHPNVVEIHELGRDRGKIFIAMEFIDGAPFPATTDRNEAIRRLAVVSRALDHVHRQGIVHRDLKPSNILVEKNGRPVLMDFGIARSEDAATTAVTATGAVLGTPGYMAPEQLSGNIREIDARTDVYALGVLLFEILTGRLPFEAATVEEFARLLKGGQTPLPRSIRKDIPAALDRLCRRAIATNKEQRPISADAFAKELIDAQMGRARNPRLVAGLVLAASAALALVAGVAAWSSGRPKEPAPAASPPASPTALLDEAAAHRAKAFGGALGFEASLGEVQACEALYRRVLDADARNETALTGLARIYAELGRSPDAHREYDRLLALDPSNIDVIRSKGGLLITEHLEHLLDHKGLPKLTKALSDVMSARQGPIFEELLRKVPDGGTASALARVYRAVARSEFEEARRLLSQMPASDAPPHLDFALQALADQAKPSSGTPLRGEEELSTGRADGMLWAALIRGLERHAARVHTLGLQRVRLHAAAQRLEALSFELRGERAKAAEALGRAAAAAPEYLEARVLHGRILKELGHRERSAKELEEAARAASAIGLPPAAVAEIRTGH